MPDLLQAITALELQGLRVKVPLGVLPTDRMLVCREQLYAGQTELPEICQISIDQRRKLWCYENSYQTTPGPGPHDIIYYSSSLDEVINATLRRYSGELSVIDGWLFPLFLHPDWDPQILTSLLNKSRVISITDWLSMPVRFRGYPDRRVH